MTKEDKMRRLNSKILAYKYAIAALHNYMNEYPDDYDFDYIYEIFLEEISLAGKEKKIFIENINNSKSSCKPIVGFDSIRPNQIKNIPTTPLIPAKQKISLETLERDKLSPCGKFIVELLEHKGMTFDEAAKLLNVSHFSLEKLLYGEIVICGGCAALLEKIFGVPKEYWTTMDYFSHYNDKPE